MSIKSFLPSVAFVIPTMNNTEGLKNLLGDLSMEYQEARVVIVNNSNASLHQKLDISSFNLQIVVLDQGKNTGFAKACNDGAKTAKEQGNPEHLIFLNDDIRFTKEWLSECLETMERKKWFATTPLLKKPTGELENMGYKVLSEGKIKLLSKDAADSLDGITAAALVVNTKEFLSMKGFDERFFAYLEDVDFFLRAKKNGKKFGITTTSYVIHQGQGTSSTMKVKKAWLDVKNWYLLLYKHWRREDYIKHGPDIVIERLRNISGLIKSFF